MSDPNLNLFVYIIQWANLGGIWCAIQGHKVDVD